MNPLLLQQTIPTPLAQPVTSSGQPLVQFIAGDMMCIISVAVLIAAVLALVVYFRHRSKQRRRSSGSFNSMVLGPKRHHRRRRRRREQFPSNPTLAQTGGLPAARQSEPRASS